MAPKRAATAAAAAAAGAAATAVGGKRKHQTAANAATTDANHTAAGAAAAAAAGAGVDAVKRQRTAEAPASSGSEPIAQPQRTVHVPVTVVLRLPSLPAAAAAGDGAAPAAAAASSSSAASVRRATARVPLDDTAVMPMLVPVAVGGDGAALAVDDVLTALRAEWTAMFGGAASEGEADAGSAEPSPMPLPLRLVVLAPAPAAFAPTDRDTTSASAHVPLNREVVWLASGRVVTPACALDEAWRAGSSTVDDAGLTVMDVHVWATAQRHVCALRRKRTNAPKREPGAAHAGAVTEAKINRASGAGADTGRRGDVKADGDDLPVPLALGDGVWDVGNDFTSAAAKRAADAFAARSGGELGLTLVTALWDVPPPDVSYRLQYLLVRPTTTLQHVRWALSARLHLDEADILMADDAAGMERVLHERVTDIVAIDGTGFLNLKFRLPSDDDHDVDDDDRGDGDARAERGSDEHDS